MSYHVYTTEGFVLEGKTLGEADKYYSIFTRELGLVFATATSVRKPESKLRTALDDLTFSELSFIRGKHRWKITNAREIENIYKGFIKEPHKKPIVFGLIALLKKFLQGEEKHEDLFSTMHEAVQFLKATPLLSNELMAFDCVAKLRILTLLGYVDNHKFASFVETSAWSIFLIHDAIPHISEMSAQISDSIEASQL